MARGQAGIASVRIPSVETCDVPGLAGTSYPAGWTVVDHAGSGTAGQIFTHLTQPAGTARLSWEGHPAYGQDFAVCAGALPGGWTQYSVAGSQVWGCTGFGRTNNGVQANGFAGTAQVNEDWLISPADAQQVILRYTF